MSFHAACSKTNHLAKGAEWKEQYVSEWSLTYSTSSSENPLLVNQSTFNQMTTKLQKKIHSSCFKRFNSFPNERKDSSDDNSQ